MGAQGMKVVLTGAEGCIGRNLIAELERRQDVDICEVDADTSAELLDEYCGDCDLVCCLRDSFGGAPSFGRGTDPAEGILRALERGGNLCPVVLESCEMETTFAAYGRRTGALVYVYRWADVFGKWSRPDGKDRVAELCLCAARGLPVEVSDADAVMRLVYIDDVLEELLGALTRHPHVHADGYCHVPVEHETTAGRVAELLRSFQSGRKDLMIPDMTEGSLEKKLYAVYLSYLPEDGFAYPLNRHEDERGSFTEILRSADRGQVSVNVIKPGVTKGDHWHHTKNEKFVAVSGRGMIRLRRHGESRIVEYPVSGEKPEVVDIPVGYTHAIANEGDVDLVVLMWCSECFDPERPDTIPEPVKRRTSGDNG